MQTELEDNEKSMAEFTEQLKKLEDEAGEIMKACQEAEVGPRLAVFVPEKYLVFVPVYPRAEFGASFGPVLII